MDRVESGQPYQDGEDVQDYDRDSNQRREDRREGRDPANIFRQTNQNRDSNSMQMIDGSLDDGLEAAQASAAFQTGEMLNQRERNDRVFRNLAGQDNQQQLQPAFSDADPSVMDDLSQADNQLLEAAQASERSTEVGMLPVPGSRKDHTFGYN